MNLNLEFPAGFKDLRCVVIGSSAGGIEALKKILPRLRPSVDFPVVIVQHIAADSPQILASFFSSVCQIPVREAEDKERLQAGVIYFAPCNYHLMVSEEGTFHLSVEEPVKYARPAIDVLFETAAVAFKRHLLGIVLTGANDDGADGLRQIRAAGGWALVQDPTAAVFPAMPRAAMEAANPQMVYSLDQIADLLGSLQGKAASI